jgi:hypothetical protein
MLTKFNQYLLLEKSNIYSLNNSKIFDDVPQELIEYIHRLTNSIEFTKITKLDTTTMTWDKMKEEMDKGNGILWRGWYLTKYNNKKEKVHFSSFFYPEPKEYEWSHVEYKEYWSNGKDVIKIALKNNKTRPRTNPKENEYWLLEFREKDTTEIDNIFDNLYKEYIAKGNIEKMRKIYLLLYNRVKNKIAEYLKKGDDPNSPYIKFSLDRLMGDLETLTNYLREYSANEKDRKTNTAKNLKDFITGHPPIDSGRNQTVYDWVVKNGTEQLFFEFNKYQLMGAIHFMKYKKSEKEIRDLLINGGVDMEKYRKLSDFDKEYIDPQFFDDYPELQSGVDFNI